MKIIRKNTFETNSSSTHSLVLVTQARPNEYHLTKSGYIMTGFGSYYTETDYSEYESFEDKLKFVLTLLTAFHFNNKLKSNFEKTGYYTQYTTKKELESIPEYQEIIELVKKNIPNCKGIKFEKNAFDEENICVGGMEAHHIKGVENMQEYLKKNNVTIEDLIFNPNIKIIMKANH